MADFILAGAQTVQIYVDPADTNYKGIRIAAEAFAGDVELVTGKKPELVDSEAQLTGPAIVVGTMAQNPLIATAAEAGSLNLSEIDGKWECYVTKLNDNVIYIVGSDKRGCIYGIYRLSEMIGVSPWVWFADVAPEKKEELKFTAEELDCVSKEPSVKYRGIFINDESPSFTGWVYGKFGGLNDKMYCHVFELILRLKGN